MKKALVLLLMISGLLAACSQNIEKEIIGTWESIEFEGKLCEDRNSEYSNTLIFSEDGSVSGVTDYEEYKIQETDNDNFDYSIMTGFGENQKFKVNITDDILSIVVEEFEDTDFNDVLSCKFEKVDG